MLVAAALLLTEYPGMAVAADNPEHPAKNARKTLVLLGAIGADSKEIRNFVNDVQSRVKDGYLTFDEERVGNGTLKLHYQLGHGIKLKRLELRYTPDDSNWRATARPDSLMVNYGYKF